MIGVRNLFLIIFLGSRTQIACGLFQVMLGDLLGNFSTTIRNTLEIFNETLGPDGRYASMYCELQYQ